MGRKSLYPMPTASATTHDDPCYYTQLAPNYQQHPSDAAPHDRRRRLPTPLSVARYVVALTTHRSCVPVVKQNQCSIIESTMEEREKNCDFSSSGVAQTSQRFLQHIDVIAQQLSHSFCRCQSSQLKRNNE